MKASTQLCICKTCQFEYGFCSLFEEYDLVVQQLNRKCLQSAMIGTENLGIDFYDLDEKKQEEVAAEMLARGSVVALAVYPKSCESFYLVNIMEEKKEKTEYVEDGFSQVIKK